MNDQARTDDFDIIAWAQGRDAPPMPVSVMVHATVRNDQPVAVLLFRDVEGQVLELHIDPSTVLDLQVQLAQFSRQVHGKY